MRDPELFTLVFLFEPCRADALVFDYFFYDDLDLFVEGVLCCLICDIYDVHLTYVVSRLTRNRIQMEKLVLGILKI